MKAPRTCAFRSHAPATGSRRCCQPCRGAYRSRSNVPHQAASCSSRKNRATNRKKNGTHGPQGVQTFLGLRLRPERMLPLDRSGPVERAAGAVIFPGTRPKCRLRCPIRHNLKCIAVRRGDGVRMKQNNTFTQTRFGSHSMNRCPRPQDRSFLIRHTVIAFFAVLVLGTGIAVHAGDESSKRFEINAKPLADALMEFGAQSGLTVVAPTSLTADKNAAAVHGDLAPGD